MQSALQASNEWFSDTNRDRRYLTFIKRKENQCTKKDFHLPFLSPNVIFFPFLNLN